MSSEKTTEARTTYLMVRDIEGQSAIEWGVDWGLNEGEELPEDVEDLTEAQYTVWKVIAVLQHLGDDQFADYIKQQERDKPSGILVPAAREKPN